MWLSCSVIFVLVLQTAKTRAAVRMRFSKIKGVVAEDGGNAAGTVWGAFTWNAELGHHLGDE